MQIRFRFTVLALLLTGSAVSQEAPKTPTPAALDLIPEDAVAAIALRSPERGQ